MQQQRIWQQLPVELELRILSFLPPNEVACSVRFVNKAAAARYSGPQYTTVQLSQHVPHHAFRRGFGHASHIWRTLVYPKRILVLSRTAVSGDLDNLDIAINNAGCLLANDVLAEAAAAGQLHVCQRLLQPGYQWCRLELHYAVYAAARGGHLEIVEWLRQQRPRPRKLRLPTLLNTVAIGCDLATLQQVYHEWRQREEGQGEQDAWDDPQQRENLFPMDTYSIINVTAGSPTPDWRDKVEWLEGLGCVRTAGACAAAASRPDAVDRLRWFRRRGYPVDDEAVVEASGKGNIPALEYLLGEADIPLASLDTAARRAAREGQLAALQALHARGCPIRGPEVLQEAADGGHLAVVVWLVEILEATMEVLAEAGVFDYAARSGNLELLAWLHAMGCRSSKHTLAMAAGGGCEAALEWLVEQGCLMPDDGMPFCNAAREGDFRTLRCLRRLGCPWGPTYAFSLCVWPATLPALQWLVAEGCPVDWREALRVAKRWEKRGRGWGPEEDQAVVEWLREEWRRRRLLAGEDASGT